MTEIIPAVMPKDFFDLSAKLSRVADAAPLVQVDIMDGVLTASRSWPYAREDENFTKMLREEEGMPFWDKLDFEFDLMVKNPEEKYNDWVNVGAKRIIFHFESTNDFGLLLKKFKADYGEAKDSPLGIEVGVALKPDTPIEAIKPFLSQVDFVQFMGIQKIGFQGQPFEKKVIDSIEALRKEHPETIISVDGGVNFETAPHLIAAGANRLVSGSALFDSENIIDAVRRMKNL